MRNSRVLDQLLINRDRLLALTLTGTNLATVLAAVLLTSFLYRIEPRWQYLAPFILIPTTLLLGESIPKLLTLGDPDRVALFRCAAAALHGDLAGSLLGVETILSRLPAPARGSARGRRERFFLLAMIWRA